MNNKISKLSKGGEGAKFLFSLFLEIGLSNIKINIFKSIKEIQRHIFCEGRAGGWAKFIFSLLFENKKQNINISVFFIEIQ